MKKIIVISIYVFLCFGVEQSYAQLGFCTGNSGDPIFTETFGTGTLDSPLPAGTTTYIYANGAQPNDGLYTVSSNTDYFDWFVAEDRTPNDINGRMLVVNSDFTPGEFYRTTINGLCENTSYEFSSWLLNLSPSNGFCGNSVIPINVKFQIWNSTDTVLLASGDTGNIGSTSTPDWNQYALVFQTLVGQTSVILKMINNGAGGCGNDLAIDDIVFKSCGDIISILDDQNNTDIAICDNLTPFSSMLTATPDFSVFSTHAYQWQQSADGAIWTDIPGETIATLNIIGLTNTMFYRVLVAENVINLSNPLCNVVSEVFEIIVTAQPNAPTSNGDITICEGQSQDLLVTVPNGVAVDWYDALSGGMLLQTDSDTYSTEIAGTYYAEAVSSNGECFSDTRTPVNLSFLDRPQLIDETKSFCEDSDVRLSANFSPATYQWNTGAITQEITTDIAGFYTVEVTNSDGCSSIKTIELIQIDKPIIDSIISDGNSVIVSTTNSGDFEYSIDGVFYQNSNTFNSLEGGTYTIHVRERSGCGIATQEFIHFVIPRYFTPNGDNYNDTFDLKGIETYAGNEVFIFDRFGKLLKSSKDLPFKWNGTFNGKLLPSSDYWYIINIEGQKIVGHFTLKR